MVPARSKLIFTLLCLCCATLLISADLKAADAPRYVIADQDASGPAGSDMIALMVFLQSTQVKLLGITIVTGDAWRDEEVAHTLRLLELLGRTDVKVYVGAEYPLVRTQQETQLFAQLYGKASWNGAWSADGHPASVIPNPPEGLPVTKAAEEDAAHFMIRMVHQYPHQVTIYAAGPMTNIALAVRLDSHFAELAKELVVMGGSLNPRTEDPEFVDTPRHEFNFWFDPEAASITLRAPWARILDTTVDASIETKPTEALFASWSHLNTPAARYLTQYTTHPLSSYMWDELAAAAWLDPSIVTRERVVYMDVNTVHGPAYGDTMIWNENDKPVITLRKVHAQLDVDFPRLESKLTELFSKPAPHEANPLMAVKP
jgi:inosine-uridine nucleoside N-ribohydrolase